VLNTAAAAVPYTTESETSHWTTQQRENLTHS